MRSRPGAGPRPAKYAAGLLALALVGGCEAQRPVALPEHARAYLACRNVARRSLEQWRQVQRSDLSPAEFERRIHFAELQSEGVVVTTLDAGLYQVGLRVRYPSDRFSGKPYNDGRVVCTLRETWAATDVKVEI
jgi:hypothetical protein